MKRKVILFLTTLVPAAFVASALAQPTRSPIASNPVAEIRGKIASVKLLPGQGMPAIEVDTGARSVTVWLGSMRYLMEQKFNPKAGDPVEVKGYSMKNAKQEEEIVAISVKLPAANQTLVLRDELGYPVWGFGWGHGCHHGPGHHGCVHR